tara:strand:- start:1569 stop:2678 length:1110 start_codon:yes stop_codon:yes gene_type:complete
MQLSKSIKLPVTLLGAYLTAINAIPLSSVAGGEKKVDDQKGVGSLGGQIKSRWYFKGQSQGAGTPNSLSAGGFIPFSPKKDSTWFLDTNLKADIADSNGSSILNGQVDETNFSTSTRLGYRWLNKHIDKMYGIYGGYDNRTLKSGDVASYSITDQKEVSLSQLAFGVEAVTDTWKLNTYALLPNENSVERINSHYKAAAIKTIGINVGKQLTPKIDYSLEYYYQSSNLDESGSGLKGRFDYDLGGGLTVGVNLSSDDIFNTRVSADFNYLFGSKASYDKKDSVLVDSMQSSPSNRDVKVHSDLDVEKQNVTNELLVPPSLNRLVDVSLNEWFPGNPLFDASGIRLSSLTHEVEFNNASELVDLIEGSIV